MDNTEATETADISDESSNSSIWSFLGGVVVATATYGTFKAYGKVKEWKTKREINKLAALRESLTDTTPKA